MLKKVSSSWLTHTLLLVSLRDTPPRPGQGMHTEDSLTHLHLVVPYLRVIHFEMVEHEIKGTFLLLGLCLFWGGIWDWMEKPLVSEQSFILSATRVFSPRF